MLVEFGDTIDAALNDAVVALDRAMAQARLPGVVETIPTYRSLLIEFEPRDVAFDHLAAGVQALLRGVQANPSLAAGRQLVVPAAYDPGFGDDLGDVADALGLEPHEVVAAHLAAEYRIYMIGFMPGFAYLGGLPARLRLPRRAAPRAHAPAGSVMIGGGQAGIAATPLPTGWYVIGRTPARGFDAARAEPFLFRAGDRVRFRAIGDDEFAGLAARAAEGAPVVEVIA
jgi:KipI family sensor histidine kinase inhibitor